MVFQQALILLVASAIAVAQADDDGIALCDSSTGYDWTTNSLGQSPCVVGSKLGGVCNMGDFTIDPLGAGLVYLGPYKEYATECRCSTVFYSMLSACSACQGREWLEWSYYSPNCSTVYSQTFNGDIPPNVNVPAWAYLDVIADDQWNNTRSYAYLLDNPAESEGITQSTSTPSSSTRSGSSTAASPSQSQDGGNSVGGSTDGGDGGGGGGSNVGAIAGGVVGGVVGLALIGLLIWFLLRRRNRNKYAATAQNAPESPRMANYQQPLPTGGDHSSYGASAPPRLYDPADPSTYPTQSAHDMPNTAYSPPMSPNGHSFAQPMPQHPPRTGPGYSGAAEI